MSVKIRLSKQEALVLADIVSDLGDRRAILRYDERLYGKWAQPTKASRQALRRVGKKLNDGGLPDDLDWYTRFTSPEKPEFPKVPQ